MSSGMDTHGRPRWTALLMVPMSAYAQRSTQTTDTQQNFRQSVKAERPTAKRHHILRSESNKGSTTGVAPGR